MAACVCVRVYIYIYIYVRVRAWVNLCVRDPPLQNAAWTLSADKQVAPFRKGKSKDEIVIKRVTQMAAEKVPEIQADYKPGSVKAAWDNHFAAFGAQDVTRIMQDYTEKSVLKAFDHTTGTLLTAKGLAQIAQFFTDLFNTLSDTSALAAPVIRTMEGTKTVDGSVYLIWSCASSGITSALDTFIHGADHRIVRQNIAFTSDPNFVPKTTTMATSKCQRSKCAAAHVCVCVHACADKTKLGFMFACISPYIHAYIHTYVSMYTV